MKAKLNNEYEEQASNRSNYQKEFDRILEISSEIKKYILYF